MKNILLSLIFTMCLAPAVSYAQMRQDAAAVRGKIDFEENHTQYPAQVKYKVGIGGGTTLFMEENRFTYLKYDPAQLEAIHDNSHQGENHDTRKEGIVNLHSFRMTFIGANPSAIVSAMNPRPYYTNYFIGNNPAKWSSHVASYEEVFYTGLYSGINLSAYSVNEEFKYDFIVAPGADPSQIKMEFTATDGIEIQNNTLIIHLSTGDMVEQIPYSYQEINHVKYPVDCEYVIAPDGRTVSFRFPNGYNQNYPLTIDPVLVAATYSGAPASCTTYGHCATYDPSGNIYTGGECFNPGYPTQAGSFQTTFGGNVDIAVACLNPNGSNLLWSTYLGGSSREIPNSLFATANGDLYVLGASNSINYPTSAGCYDASYNGSSSGADNDIVVTHVLAGGATLGGSTYVGGSAEDGGGWGMPWNMNGHDGMRGEIVVDGAGNAWVASFSESANFPTSAGTYDNTLGGTWDGVVFRLNTTCSALGWSTYIGGSGADGAYALRVTPGGEAFCTGVTCSNDFPATVGTYDGTFNGGTSDGFIARFDAAGSTLVAATYFGTSGNEICYFMDTDGGGNPYVYGVSTGNMPVTPGVYSNANASNFVTKFDPYLFSITFSTVFGSGPASYLEPEAFMIDSCENIYCSGFNSQSTYPVTAATALYPTQASCGGGSAYFIVLSKDALGLSFGSFYYGWHVDGGTSRFDPQGAIYQGICIGGGGAPTPAWAWKDNVNAPGWDMYVVKVDFQMAGVNAVASASTNTICDSMTVWFQNTSNGVQYYWDFGDGSPIDTSMSPGHMYPDTGMFVVMLVAVDSNSCNVADTMYLPVHVIADPEPFIGNDTTVCGPLNLLLDATQPSCTYLWSTGAVTPTITVTTPGTYWVTCDNGSCIGTDTINILAFALPDIGSDTIVCTGTTLLLDAGNPGSTYLWSTGSTSQTITVNSTGIYWVDVTSGSCSFRDSIDIQVLSVQQPDLGLDTAVCPGGQIIFSVNDPNATITWQDGSVGQTFTADSAGTYWVTSSIGNCALSDTVNVTYLATVELGSEQSLCNVDQGITLDAGNPGSQYMWNTGETSQMITITEAGTYYVDVINSSQCALTDTIDITGELGGGTMYVPNTFTPNGNNRNDVFYVYGTGIVEFKMQIYDRWGMLLFESTSMTDGWDGTFMGNKVQQDTYVVKITYRTECGDMNIHKEIRHVNVLR